MRGSSVAAGCAFLCALTVAGVSGAEAGCTRRIVNKSGHIALVSRDGGPWVAVGPRRSQAIRYEHSGRIDVALTCGRGAGPEGASFRASYDTVAVIDRCYIHFGDGFFEDKFGPGTFGAKDTGPLVLNNPRQGDLIVGPGAGSCAAERGTLRARY